MDALRAYFRTTFAISLETGLRYSIAAGLGWLLFYVLLRRRLACRKIIPQQPSTSEVLREIKYAALTVLIFGAVGATTFFAIKAGSTRMYFRLSQHSGLWFWCSVGLTILLHDTWFYWTHRAMHHRTLFRWFHRTHHLSTNPSPWAAYAFGPLEALIQAAIFPLAVYLIPQHPLAFFIFMLWQITFNVLGHTGYEIFPSWLLSTWLGKLLNTPTSHIMHHERLRGNYGLYFNVWDRLMGTNHKDYEARFREVTFSRSRGVQPVWETRRARKQEAIRS